MGILIIYLSHLKFTKRKLESYCKEKKLKKKKEKRGKMRRKKSKMIIKKGKIIIKKSKIKSQDIYGIIILYLN